MAVSIHSSMICRRAPPTLTDDADSSTTKQSKQDANDVPPLPERRAGADLTENTNETGGKSAGSSAEHATKQKQLRLHAKSREESETLRVNRLGDCHALNRHLSVW